MTHLLFSIVIVPCYSYSEALCQEEMNPSVIEMRKSRVMGWVMGDLMGWEMSQVQLNIHFSPSHSSQARFGQGHAPICQKLLRMRISSRSASKTLSCSAKKPVMSIIMSRNRWFRVCIHGRNLGRLLNHCLRFGIIEKVVCSSGCGHRLFRGKIYCDCIYKANMIFNHGHDAYQKKLHSWS